MTDYTQANRPIRVDTVLGEDVLLLRGFAGEEGVSTPFGFTLDLLSQDKAIDPQGILRTAASVTVALPDGSNRLIHGRISRFVELGQDPDAELAAYRAELVPWIWFLSLSTDCRIFQQMTVLEIVEQVFRDQGYEDFAIECTKSYDTRDYCVQYRETHLSFVSRLLEEEGVSYYFVHSGSRHVLTLIDDVGVVLPCAGVDKVRIAPESSASRGEDIVTSLEREHAAYPGAVSLRHFDYLQPSLILEGSVSGDGQEELYDWTFPGNHLTTDNGERLVRLMLEEHEQWREVIRGTSTCRSFEAGHSFELEDYFRGATNQAYHLLSVIHSARLGDYRATGNQTFEYSNHFRAIPLSTPFRPPRITPKPLVQGSQTAIVVGKSGEEIWVDQHGRVKVQFHWDRRGQNDEHSSCWVRVATTWAGKGWGAISLPRIGQEVIVDFLEGDPDLPIITGRVYNAEQVPPYALPGGKSLSGVKSRSTKGGGTENFNEIRMEDRKGSEVLYIHAEKDEESVVENDRTDSVKRDESTKIGRDRTENVGRDERITVGNDRTEVVDGDESIRVGKNRTKSVGDNERISIGASRSETVAKDEGVSVGQNRSHQVGKDDTLDVGKNFVLNAGDSVTIKTGSASITMKKNGDILIKGKNIKLQGSGKIQIKASSEVNIKGSKVTSN